MAEQSINIFCRIFSIFLFPKQFLTREIFSVHNITNLQAATLCLRNVSPSLCMTLMTDLRNSALFVSFFCKVLIYFVEFLVFQCF
jgi:hypothetical protein